MRRSNTHAEMDEHLKGNIDYITLGIVMLLVAIGAGSVYSATYDAGASLVFYRQLIFSGVGLVIMATVALLPFRTLQFLSYPLYGITLFLLLAVLVMGRTIAGSTSWFGVGGFGMQPSELVKATTILAIGSYLSQRTVNINRLKDILITAGFSLIPVGLILLQPDMGTAIIYLGTLLLVMYWAGASNFLVITVMAPGFAALAALVGTTAFVIVLVLTLLLLLFLRENRFLSALVFSLCMLVGVSVQVMFAKLAPYQQNRILTFVNPDADPLGSGYNVMQSKIAIGSGGIFGKGFLQGTQTQLNFLPAQWTDFIFCVPSEEFGFIGAFITLVLLIALLLRGVYIASTVKSRYASVVAIGIVSTFFVHIIINIGMAMGMFPVIGVPLPFMSYGGSNLLTNMLMVGLLLNVYANRKEY